jgi:N,N'-diacetyllegionaminate synthase
VNERKQITIVAEAAQGYEGNATQARLLARCAAKAGADLVKFQLVYADELAVPNYPWYQLFKTLEMPARAWQDVRNEAERLGIGLAFDVFGQRSLAEAVALEAKVIKLHVTDFFNEDLVNAVFSNGVEVHAALGGVPMDEIDAWLERRRDADRERLVLLYGFQAEPTAIEDNNLSRLRAMSQSFPRVRFGWMDHSSGDADEAEWLGVLAVPYGVSVIEKHITLSRPLELEDGVSALDAGAFERYVARIRTAEAAVGIDTPAPTDVEKRYLSRALKVAVAATKIGAGERLGWGAVALKRALLDESRRPYHSLGEIVGRKAARDLPEAAVIYAGDVE